jgi:hypothetical protein
MLASNTYTIVQVSLLFYWSAGFGRVVQILRQRPIQRQPLLVQYKQQATFINAQSTPLVISGTDTNKQITLLTQCKLALTGRNM